jgi:DNA polymerase/3'-5' exonuclease PolX
MVGDIELVAVPRLQVNLFGEPQPDEPTELDAFLLARGVQFTKNGAKYKQFKYQAFAVDLFLQPDAATWGMNYTIRTGSADFTKWLVTKRSAGGAMPEGVRCSDARLWHGGQALDTPEEEDVFLALGLDFVPPPERQNGRWNGSTSDTFV